jgi:hypothetical protein
VKASEGLTITVRIEITGKPDRYLAAYALYAGKSQLFPYETLQRVFTGIPQAQQAARDAATEAIAELRRAEVEFKTEVRE